MSKKVAPGRLRDCVPVVNYAIVDRKPKSLKIKDHLFPYEGSRNEAGLIWGVYGTASIDSALFLAEAEARRRGALLLTINFFYHLPGFNETKELFTAEIAAKVGFFHIQRISSSFREHLRQMAEAHARHPVVSLEEHIKANPGFIRYLFKKEPRYKMIVHPVFQSYDPSDRAKLWVATCRNDPELVLNPEVRFMSDVAVQF